MGFDSFNFHPSLRKALVKVGFETATPIQAQAIPVALEGRDVLGCAQTGSGKTAAFCLPAMTHLLGNRDAMVLVLVPTRELAAQVGKVAQELSEFAPEIQGVILIGGVSMNPQIQALRRRPNLVIATPGRLLDHVRRGGIRLERVSVLVLDEADRMLDLGFMPQLREILRFLPKQRQTMLFSATLPPEILDLASRFVQNPVRVSVASTPDKEPKIEQKTIAVDSAKKREALLDALNARKGSVLVFARTQHRTDRLARYLESYGVDVARIHGGRSQGQRTRALDGFRDGSIRVLVATDIAARGIDIDHVGHVINFDLPQVAEDYVHRIGRTGRAGRSGEALSLIAPEDRSAWRDIERMLAHRAGGGAGTNANGAGPTATRAFSRQGQPARQARSR